MKIAINADSRKIVTWSGTPIAGLAMTRRDIYPIEVKFIQGSGYVELPVGAAGQLALKQFGEWNDIVRASGGSWKKTGTGRDAIYTFILSLDTPELNALFLNEPDSLPMVIEVTWTYPIGLPASWPLKGDYDNGYSYALNDVVLYQGELYYRHSNPLNPGYPPTVGSANDSWTPIMQARETATAVPVTLSNDYIR